MKLYDAIKKSFPRISGFFSEEKLLEFSHTPANDLEKYNFGLGTMIRIKLLRPKSGLYKKFVQYGYTDIDEMTMAVIKVFHKYLQSRR